MSVPLEGGTKWRSPWTAPLLSWEDWTQGQSIPSVWWRRKAGTKANPPLSRVQLVSNRFWDMPWPGHGARTSPSPALLHFENEKNLGNCLKASPACRADLALSGTVWWTLFPYLPCLAPCSHWFLAYPLRLKERSYFSCRKCRPPPLFSMRLLLRAFCLMTCFVFYSQKLRGRATRMYLLLLAPA